MIFKITDSIEEIIYSFNEVVCVASESREQSATKTWANW